jgi:hypothetical protein
VPSAQHFLSAPDDARHDKKDTAIDDTTRTNNNDDDSMGIFCIENIDAVVAPDLRIAKGPDKTQPPHAPRHPRPRDTTHAVQSEMTVRPAFEKRKHKERAALRRFRRIQCWRQGSGANKTAAVRTSKPAVLNIRILDPPTSPSTSGVDDSWSADVAAIQRCLSEDSDLSSAPEPDAHCVASPGTEAALRHSPPA